MIRGGLARHTAPGDNINDYGYEQWLNDQRDMTERDREIRFRVLETANRVDHEMIATALEYRLTGGNPGLAPDQRARVAEEALFSGSAGRHKALKILRAAASACSRDAAAEPLFDAIKALAELRNLLAPWHRRRVEQLGRLGAEKTARDGYIAVRQLSLLVLGGVPMEPGL